jgi:twitching motility protein PilT
VSNDNNLAVIEPWLQILWDNHGSDLLLAGGSAPRVRIDGDLRPIQGAPVLSGKKIDEFIRSLLDPVLIDVFEEQRDVDFAISWREKGRLRCSAFTAKGESALAMRIIPFRIPGFTELGLPPAIEYISNLRQGFVLVTGPTGAGKSTTLASILDRINESRASNILTIEDPIEYIHHHKQSAVLQREVGFDSPSFHRALRSALREDPDVLLLGEMRDEESMQAALTLAETGHLVFATLHTNDAPQTVDRIINAFPEGKQEMIRMQLSACFAAVISQRLVPRVNGGMVAAFEILTSVGAVRNLIREGKTNQLLNVMRTSSKDGMKTLEMSLVELISEGTISLNSALQVSTRPDEILRDMEQLMGAKI